jgi:hypothetical protein
VAAQEVIRHPPPDAIERDPLADDGAVGGAFVSRERQHLRGQHLDLQRHGEPVFRAARSEAQEHLAGNEHLARDPALIRRPCRAAGWYRHGGCVRDGRRWCPPAIIRR